MNSKKIILGVASGIVAIIALAISINLVLHSEENESGSTATLFTNVDGRISEIENGESVAELGNLRFGKFALFQLTDGASRLELISVNYDEEMEVVNSAIGRVNAGVVSAVNLLFGSTLTLLDDRVAVASRGGSFTLEEKDESTIVRIFSGSAKISFSNVDSGGIFDAALIAGEKVRVDDELIANIFASGDETERREIWRRSVGIFAGNIQEEIRLASELLAKIDAEKFSWFDSLREKLTFAPATKTKLFERKFLDKFSANFSDPQKLDELLTKPSKKEQLAAKKVLPFTRIFLPGELSPGLKMKIRQLAASSSILANFAGTDDLAPATRLNRDLVLLLDDPTSASPLVAFLAKKNALANSDSETTALLFRLISENSNLVATNWVVAWNIANAKIASTDPVSAIATQLALTQIFVADGRGALAAESLKKLVEMISENQSVFSREALETIAAEGNELKNRIAFLATLPAKTAFDEEMYEGWVFEKEKAALADDGKVARPESELSKLLDSTTENSLENLLDEYLNGANTPPAECAELAENLENCAEYDCEFTHPLSGEKLARTVAEASNGECILVEQMPGGGEMKCNFDEATRKKVAAFYRVALGSDDLGASEIENPLDTATADGICVVSGF